VADGKTGYPAGIATINIAIDTLKVAEMLTGQALEKFRPS